MGVAQPALGFTSRTEAALALIAQGLQPREIARRITAETPGRPITPQGVRSILQNVRAQAARDTHPIPFSLMLPADCFSALVAAGAARGIRADELARRVLTLAATENLIDAILDDGGDE